MEYIGVALCMLPAVAAGLGMGIATGKAADAVGRQPEASVKITSTMLLGMALTESCAIYGLVMALIMFFSI